MRRSDNRLKTLALAGIFAGAFPLPLAAEAPTRVVSMNLCTDQLAMMLAGPGQLISISRIARDPVSSAMAAEAVKYPVNSGRAEEIFAQNPDLVLGGTYTDPFAVQMLRDLGVEVVQFPIVSHLEDIPGVVRQMGTLLGRVGTAEVLALEVESRLANAQLVSGDAPQAAFFFANGYSLGAGTLSHDIISTAGFENLAESLGRSGGGRLSLEELLMNRPDVLVTGTPYPATSRSEEIMAHPALEGIPRVLSGPEWVCGTPLALNALDQMEALREELQ